MWHHVLTLRKLLLGLLELLVLRRGWLVVGCTLAMVALLARAAGSQVRTTGEIPFSPHGDSSDRSSGNGNLCPWHHRL
jgi:hypothetical protein